MDDDWLSFNLNAVSSEACKRYVFIPFAKGFKNGLFTVTKETFNVVSHPITSMKDTATFMEDTARLALNAHTDDSLNRWKNRFNKIEGHYQKFKEGDDSVKIEMAAEMLVTGYFCFRIPGVIRTGKTVHQAILEGREFQIGKDFRVAPFGNRTEHFNGKLPHYHRRSFDSEGKVKKGQSLNRHRPWDKNPSDKSFWDRL